MQRVLTLSPFLAAISRPFCRLSSALLERRSGTIVQFHEVYQFGYVQDDSEKSKYYMFHPAHLSHQSVSALLRVGGKVHFEVFQQDDKGVVECRDIVVKSTSGVQENLPPLRNGTVVKFRDREGFGFILDSVTKRQYYFSKALLADGAAPLRVGDNVAFRVMLDSHNRVHASHVAKKAHDQL